MVDVADSSPLLTAALSVIAASLVWWSRVRRLTVLRNNVALINALSEEILSANTAEEAEAMASKRLEQEMGVSSVKVILKDQAKGAAADAMTSGRPIEEPAGKTIYFPMISGTRPAGAFSLSWPGEKCPFQIDERAALQHLANQIAITFELHDRRFQREQVLRGEKLGAAGRLIAAVAAEMAEPLARVSSLAASMPESSQSEAILQSVTGAKETLDRLLALGQSNLADLSPFDASAVVAGLVEFRKRNWEMRSLVVTLDLAGAPIPVVGVRGAFEHALLDLLVHAEQAAESAGKPMSLSTKLGDSEASIEIGHPPSGMEEISPLLDTVTGIAETLGGQARVGTTSLATNWVITLPVQSAGAEPGAAPARSSMSRTLSCLLVDPNPASTRSLIEKLAHRGHRVVPAAGGGEAVDMANAIHFDTVFTIPNLPDMAWPELFERTRMVGCRTVLLCDSLAPLSHALVQGGEAFALKRPVEEADLDKVLLSITPVE
jgi:signal transduction histidine kinase